MTEHDPDDSAPGDGLAERDRCIDYEVADGTVSVIRNTQNEDAWIQSTHAVAVER